MNVAFYVSFGALWVLVILQTIVLLGVTRALHEARQSGMILDNNNAGLRGQPAPAFSAVDTSGTVIDNGHFLGHQTALLFVSPDCETCAVTLSELEALKARMDGNVILLCRSTKDRCVQMADTYRLNVPVIVDEDLEFSRLFLVPGAPTAVLIGEDGRIEAYGQPMSAEELAGTMENHEWGQGEIVPDTGITVTTNGDQRELSSH